MSEKLSETESAFVSLHRTMVGQALNGNSASLVGLRQNAINTFANVGLPARKSEAWKYTNINAVLTKELAARLSFDTHKVKPRLVNESLIPGLDSPFVVVNNGVLDLDSSNLSNLPNGVVVTTLQDAAEKHRSVFDSHFGKYVNETEGLAVLNTAFVHGGLFVFVPKGIEVAETLQVVHVVSSTESSFIQPRTLFVVEEAASLSVIERLVSATDSATVSNRVIETYTGKSSRLSIIRVQDENVDSSTVTSLYSVQERDSYVYDLTLSLSGKLIRNNLNFRHLDSHCETHLNGFFIGRGDNQIDNHSIVDHAMPDCYSNETFKGVLYDNSTGVFNGKVLVRRDAQRTNAYQSNRSIVVSDSAHMYSKPELEIYADDVKCSHGATTGRLEPESMFYLQSRGLSEERARALLLGAFAREVVESVANPVVREYLTDELNRRVL
ncbi:MAG: Fe-S cluster assembly protein SufD [Rhodothermales bacterium]|nr:Fe-S cluster assembly protein SufD [Rhodothermales bacterium]